jgi:hypothetical protein
VFISGDHEPPTSGPTAICLLLAVLVSSSLDALTVLLLSCGKASASSIKEKSKGNSNL